MAAGVDGHDHGYGDVMLNCNCDICVHPDQYDDVFQRTQMYHVRWLALEPGPARDAWDVRLRRHRREAQQGPRADVTRPAGWRPPTPTRPAHHDKPPPILPGTPLLIKGSTTSWTGYGQICEWLGRSLEALNVNVVYESTHHDPRYFDRNPFILDRLDRPTTSPWHIRLDVPFADFPPGMSTIAFTMWETSRVKDECIPVLNQTAAVIVPCQWNAKCLREQGVTVPIHVVPLGMDPKTYRPTKLPPFGWRSPVFRFGTSGRVSHGGSRKGLEEACQSFLRAFPRDHKVRLDVKVWPDCDFTPPKDWRITINREPMNSAQIGDWYRTLHCYVTATKGEGFGLQTLQAMAVGRPVIAAKATGTAEFFDATCGWEVDYEWQPASSFYDGLGIWPVPDEASLALAMQTAVADREACERKAEAAVARARNFTWGHTGLRLKRTLGVVGCLVLPDDLTPGHAARKAAENPAEFLAKFSEVEQETAKACPWRETVVMCCGPTDACGKPNHPWHRQPISTATCLTCVKEGWNKSA